jgi:hypothetical protein
MRKTFSVLFSFLLVLAVALSTVGPAFAQSGRGGGLSKHDRELLADAIVNGKPTVTVLIASLPGNNNTVASAVRAMGGDIRYRDDGLDYLRAVVPTGNVQSIAKLSGILAINLDELIPLEEPVIEVADDQVQVNPPGAGTPALNGYMPTRDIGAPQFVAANPTFDGRGVKIAIVDGGVDLLAPELQTATLLDGTPTRKIVEWVNANDFANDPSWINMEALVTAVGGSFGVGADTYVGAPADGEYHFGVFAEQAVNSLQPGSEYAITGCGTDINRNGACTDKFAVLWETNSNMVWVDTDSDKDFSDQIGMTDYHVNYDFDLLGVDNSATPVRESVPYVIQTDGQRKYINIGIVGNAHGTHVAGIAAGKDFFGGAFDGAAPEAQIISIRVCIFGNSCTSAGLIEGMIFAAQQAGADVINMSIGGLPALNDGNNTRVVLYNRLIEQYKVQMFLSAGNSGPGLNTIGDPAVASKAVGVGAYVTSDSWMLNYGADVAKADGLFVFSSRGPVENGGFKPNIVAPGSAVSTIPAWQPVAGQCLAYTCAPGYAMFNGTSMAAPQATGGAALLISAAKQMGIQYKPEQLRQAIFSSARFIPGYGAYEQGNGLFQVGAAWDLLKTNIKTVEITSKAPVKTVISNFLATPHFGVGLYEREGWTAGQSASRTITFTRTSGGSKAIKYNLSLVGNDGTFSTGSNNVTLALNKGANLTVNVAPATSGVHSAVLNLDDPSTVGVDYQVMLTVVAAAQFNAGNNFTVVNAGSADRADKATFFFYVPANTPAYKIDLQVTSGRARLWNFHPYGVPFPNSTTGVTAYCTAPCTVSHTVSNPLAGVWEASVEVSRASTAQPTTFSQTASILGVDIDPTSWTVSPFTVGTVYNQSFSFTNRFGAFTGGAVGTGLSSAFSARPSISAGGAQQVYLVDVPANSTSILARIGNSSDQAADLDLYLYDCHANPCVLRGSGTTATANEAVSFANPAAGQWKIVVDPYSVPAGTAAYDYFDAFANAGLFGSITVTDAPALHANNSTWTAPASVTALAMPAAGRFLQGFVQVKSGTTLLGQAEVRLVP